eukprot:CAMPEP_0119149040 /NCGR_PEP_ID=MMETSP1310-20130426/42778_1 /TAXON_ID=464262 /ORGANISM="Genus nov. species nov., Strain RCC2339" /LENGTH=143 /DNA_ID=CAMNT_0007141117 /DNA_START=1 /DNA_END=428 /DNA_ORIENTATION=-
MLGLASFSSDVKILEITRDKSGSVVIQKLMALLGHKSSVLNLSIAADGSRAVSSSKDGTWKMWKMDIEFKGVANPECLLTATHPEKGQYFDLVRLSPGCSRIVAVTNKSRTVYLYTAEGQLVHTILSAHTDLVTSVGWVEENL